MIAALGLKPGSNPLYVKPMTYWLKWENAEAEMLAVSKAYGVAEQMPTGRQLEANGYNSLSNAITKTVWWNVQISTKTRPVNWKFKTGAKMA